MPAARAGGWLRHGAARARAAFRDRARRFAGEVSPGATLLFQEAGLREGAVRRGGAAHLEGAEVRGGEGHVAEALLLHLPRGAPARLRGRCAARHAQRGARGARAGGRGQHFSRREVDDPVRDEP